MRRIHLWFSFSLAALFLFFGTIFLPDIRIWPFSPFLAISFYRVTFIRSLWLSFFCGLLLDLFSSQFPLGLMALIQTLTTFLLYGQKRHFFEDKPIAFSLYSALIASLNSLFLILLQPIVGKQFPITLHIFVSDILLMPFFDAIYALVWFTCPAILFSYFTRFTLENSTGEEE